MYRPHQPFGGGNPRPQQVQFNPNFLPTPNNNFLPQQDPNFVPYAFQYPPNLPGFPYHFPNNIYPIPSNPNENTSYNRNNNNNNVEHIQQAKPQKETIEKLDKAARKAQSDILSSGENVSAWKVSQAALSAVKAVSWESLGCKMQQVPSLNRLLVAEGKVNSLIHCFIAVRSIISLYDLELAICESERIKQFEQLELGPIVRHPLIMHYFEVNSEVTEVYRISTEAVISYLFEFMESHSKREVKVDTLLDYISKKQSVGGREKLCVRIQDIRTYINQIKNAKRSQQLVLEKGLQQMRKRALKRRDKRPLFSAQKEKLDDHFTAISQRIKSFSSENSEFCGKHTRFVSSSSEDNDSTDDEYKDDYGEASGRSSCSLPLSNVKTNYGSSCPFPSATEEMSRLGLKNDPERQSPINIKDNECSDGHGEESAHSNRSLHLSNVKIDHGSSCPYPSATEEKSRLGLKKETERQCSFTPDGAVRCTVENGVSKKRKRFKDMPTNISSSRKQRTRDTFSMNVTHKSLPSGNRDIHSFSEDDLKIFVSTWKETCRGSNANEVLEKMIQFYNLSLKKKFKALFKRYPFIGLLNAAISCINSGMWDNMYDTFQAIDKQGVDGENFDVSADYISIDIQPALDATSNSAHKTHSYKHDVTAEDVAKKISGYFEDTMLSNTSLSPENPFSLLRKLHKCQHWLLERYTVDKFEALGFGEYSLFIEKYMHLLPRELQKCLMGGIHENTSLDAHLLPLQLDTLLSQAFSSLWENKVVNLGNISELLARQFPSVCFKLQSEVTESFVDIVREKKCTRDSTCLLYSTPLLGLNHPDELLAQNANKMEVGCREGKIGAVTTNDAIQVLLKAPMLIELNTWSHWDLLFAPSLGSLLEWLLMEVNSKELLCLVTKGGKIIRMDHSATPDSFLKVFIQGSAFETAVELLSLYALYGGQHNVPVALLKCHARQAFEVMISNSLDTDLNDDHGSFIHGMLSGDIGQLNARGNLGGGLLDDKSGVNKTVSLVSRFILDCLSYLPIEFCSSAADILIAGLQSFVKGVPLAILTECKQIKQRLILHEVGFSLGITEWINDYHLYHSFVATENIPALPCLGVVTSESNVQSDILQNLPNKIIFSDETLVSSETGYDDATAEFQDNGSAANSEQILMLDSDTNTDAARVIKSIREDEFGLDLSLSATENRMLEKQHARLGRALHCLSQELYSQDSHFLLELIQNADDNIYLGNVEPTLSFILQKNRIVVLNNENGFFAKNVRALCDIGNSTKKGNNAGYIGKKGIGFKSVFRVTDAPEIHSNGFHIKFDITEDQIGFVLPTVVPPCDIDSYSRLAYGSAGGMGQKSWNTCILLPFKQNSSEGCAINNIVSMFSDLHPSLLLFLHRLKCIMFRNVLDDSLISMRKEILGNGMVQVTFGNEKMTWFVVSQELQANVIRSDVQRTELSLAFTLHETENGVYVPIVKQQPVFAFLPLRTYGLKFILQGDFVLPSSREEVDVNSPWNQWLLSQFPDLFVGSERKFCDLPSHQGNVGKAVTTFMSFVPLVGEVHGFFSSLPRMIISKLRISNCLILDGDKNDWVPPCKVLRNWTDQSRVLLPDSFLHDHLGLGFLNKDIVLSDTLARALGVEDYGPSTLLRIISSVVHSETGLTSVGLSWLSSWLSAIYVMLCHSSVKTSLSFASESDILCNLQKTPFVPLSDGKFGSVDEDTIWLHSGANDEYLFKAFPEIYSKLRIVSPELLAAAASVESSCPDATIVENVTRMLQKVGVQQLSVHDIVKVHILPALSDDKNATGKENLMTEYLAFVMLHLQSSCTSCKIERDSIILEFREKALVLTNYGFKRPSDVPIHFSQEYNNPIDMNRLINGVDVRWHELDNIYLKHPITKSLSDGLLKWRTFFQDIGVSDFVQIVQVEKRLADMSFVDIKDIMQGRDKMLADSVVKSWESEELFHLLSWISSRHDGEKAIYLMEILDSLWDTCFSDKLIGHCNDSTGECRQFRSSLISILQDVPWIASSIDKKLHFPKDLYHDCLTVNSVFGGNAPYTIPKVKSEKLQAGLGLKIEVSLDDALAVLALWRTSQIPLKASISQMTEFYGFIWKRMDLSKKKIMEELHSGSFIFIPYTSSSLHEEVVPGVLLSPQDVYWHDNISQTESVHYESYEGLATPPLRKMLCGIYPNLHHFFVNECGVNEAPPLRSYLQILLHMSTVSLPHQAAKGVFDVFLRWADALKSGLLSPEDVKYLKECLLKKEYAILPTKQDKWVSLHSSFGLVCWLDDEKLGKEFKYLKGVDFLSFGKSTEEESQMLDAKVSMIIQRIGIPTLSEIVTREAIHSGSKDCNSIHSLVNWVLPYAQRFIHNEDPKKYHFQLKQSAYDNLKHLKILVIDKLFYRNVIKRCDIISKKKHECDCLLQDNILYCVEKSDLHSIFLELSRLLYGGTQELHFANFLHMITTMAQSGTSEEQVEYFILNSQKVQKLPVGESCWSLEPLEQYHPEKTEEKTGERTEEKTREKTGGKTEEQTFSASEKKSSAKFNWPPVSWKTALLEMQINEEFTQEGDQIIVTPEKVSGNQESFKFESNIKSNLVTQDSGAAIVDSLDLLSPNGIRTNFNKADQISSQQAQLTGKMGEHVAFNYFMEKIGNEMSVKWVNEVNETGLPYDIIIGDDEDSREYIEVKATKYGRKNWFLVSMREWQFAVEKGDSFSIAHVILEDDNMAKVTVYRNPAGLCRLGNMKLAMVVPKE